jgi:hypothetical protein
MRLIDEAIIISDIHIEDYYDYNKYPFYRLQQCYILVELLQKIQMQEFKKKQIDLTHIA